MTRIDHPLRTNRLSGVAGGVLLFALFVGCGGSSPSSSDEDTPAEELNVPAKAMDAQIPVELGKPVEPAAMYDVVSDLWVNFDGEYARIKFTVELENLTSEMVAPTFVSIEEYNWVSQAGERVDVGGGVIGIRRALELAPGERVFMNRGDFTTLGRSEFERGRYEGAGMNGVIKLEDASGQPFQLSFEYAETFSMGDDEVPVSEPWAGPPSEAPASTNETAF